MRRWESEAFQGLCPVLPVRWPPLAAVVLHGDSGKSFSSEVKPERLPVPALTDTECSLARSHTRTDVFLVLLDTVDSRERNKKKKKQGLSSEGTTLERLYAVEPRRFCRAWHRPQRISSRSS